MLPVVESICTSTLFRLILHSLKSPQTPQAIADWASRALSPESTVLSDGLAGFAGGTEAGCIHQRTVVGERKPKDLSLFHWVNTILGKVKTSLSGTYHAFGFNKYAERYLGAIADRFRDCLFRQYP